MKYDVKEAGQIRELVLSEQKKGNTIVAFLDSDESVLYKSDLSFFNNGYDAAEFCFENSTDVDHMRMTSTAHVLQDIEYQLIQTNELTNLNNKIMKQENYDYLKQQVKNAGFGEALDNELKEKMESNEPKFQLKQDKQFGKDAVEATLNFRKNDQNENYYFNNYEVAIKKDPENLKKPTPKQTFYVGKDNNFSVDEAYNLLNNRFVNKDLVNAMGESYNGWVKLNFKEAQANGNYKMQHYTDKWQFNLETALDKFPMIKELSKELNNGADRANLIAALKKGGRPEITLVRDGVETKGHVEANPYLRSVRVTDENNNKVSLPKKEEVSQSENQDQSQNKKENQKQQNKNADETVKTERKSRKQRQSV